ncbi:mechanosensitive ion channel family protein [Flavobacteriaceae bacterium]|jgi:small-conductance mechanosensitive channel|nr:mechanosensitive ion channel family protein [Flavobacteriaceae bacterium]
MTLSNLYFELIATGVLFLILLISRALIIGLIRRFSHSEQIIDRRVQLITKLINYVILGCALVGVFVIWGVDVRNLGVILSSIFAVIGVAFFAQWSILSNITSGVIMFFTFPYKIGDRIMIHDKEYEYVGIIEDIKTFHIVLVNDAGQRITYPNSLVLQKGVSILNQNNNLSSEPASNDRKSI